MSSFDETTETPHITSDPLVGELVGGKYRVLGAFAQGGMAKIYRAEQEPLGRIVALKALVPNPSAAHEEGARFEDRFFLEAATCAKLKHPNTVTLFDYGHHPKTGHFYMIMELVEGRSLSQLIKEEGALHPIRALSVAIEICRSLQEAHQLGIVHRDLKPSNVMITDTLEGEGVKVLDFGIAKVLQADSQSITMEDRIVGSPRYMAPEQISQGKIDGRTDVYALGIMLFEMITGRAPFQGQTAIQTLMKHMNQPVPLLSTHTPSTVFIHHVLDDLVASCMAKDPKLRPGSIDQLKQKLRETIAVVADSTEDMRLSTESVVRHAQARMPAIPEVEYSQPTLNRPITEESTFTQAAPVLVGLGGLTVVGLGALVTVAMGAAAIAWVAYGGAQPEAKPAPGPVPVTAPAPAPSAAPVLTIRSEPSGAEVWEGTKLLGVTPLEVEAAGASERRFEVRLEGHESAELASGPIGESTEITAQLRPIPRVGPKPGPAPAPSSPDLDVIERR